MNNTGTRVFLMSVLCTMLVISSCQPDNLISRSGKPIRFTVASASTLTKTAYDATNPETINWEAGDLISVYCAQASEPDSKCADYEVSEVSDPATQASIANVGGVGLIWGDDDKDHVFYAMYPSGTIGDGTMSGSIPATQKPKSLNATAASATPHFTAVPDLSMEYMVATNTIEAGEFDPEEALGASDGVFLNFKPIVTAIEFTITNAFAADAEHPENEILKIKNIQLTSASHNIAGDFTADLTDLSADGSTYPECTSTSTGKTVTMDFTSIPDYTYADNANKYIKVAKGQTLRFTFFLKPEYSGTPAKALDVDDLTFKIVKSDGSWLSTKLAYNDADKTGITFPCHKKSYVTGILVPEGAQWTVKYDPTVEHWNNGGATPINPAPQVNRETLVTSWDSSIDDELELRPVIEVKFIDLGLPSGTLWADKNIGAISATDPGDYFAWGETSPRTTDWAISIPYNWTNTPFNDGAPSFNATYFLSNLSNWVDGDTLKPQYDAASAAYGDGASMPTALQIKELFDYTNMESIELGRGLYAQKFINKSDNSKYIIIPYAEWRNNDIAERPFVHLWSSTLNTSWVDEETPSTDCDVYYFHYGKALAMVAHSTIKHVQDFDRRIGMPVRAVKKATE